MYKKKENKIFNNTKKKKICHNNNIVIMIITFLVTARNVINYCDFFKEKKIRNITLRL